MTRERDEEVVSSKPPIHFLPFWGQIDWGMEMLQKRKRSINLVKSSCEQLVFELLIKKKKKSTYVYQLESLYLWNPFGKMYLIHLGFLGGSEGKESAAMQETWVQSLHQEDPLEKEMATHSSILVWRTQWTQKPGMLQSTVSQSRI